ncbi:glycosyltransferase [Nitrosomonas sp. Nm34]|uniref:glycosyltransferase n=1 Tax=Nitrosomonas sp. Nm34 TaxID=1881055 RepID=UPI0008E906DA|nr:glycosyltransferase [Nitrosomonas sp. Nm34]SFI57780.1 Glycosyl transferases group 1 [Nitrosomonas sp. Nm34]
MTKAYRAQTTKKRIKPNQLDVEQAPATSLAALFATLPQQTSAEHFYAQPILGLDVPGISPFYGLHLAIWQIRDKDLQQMCPLTTIDGRHRFLAWCVVHGRKEYVALRELIPFWQTLSLPAELPVTEWSGGISRFMQLVIMERKDLDINSSLATSEDQLAVLGWFWCAGGWRELDLAIVEIPAWQKHFLIDHDEIDKTCFAHLLYQYRADLRAAFDLTTTRGCGGFRHWLEHYAPQETALPLLTQVKPQTWSHISNKSSTTHQDFGINLIGYAFGELGIGEDVRMAAHAFQAANIPFTVIDFPPGSNIHQQDRSIEQWVSSEPRYSINLVCLTALEQLRLYITRGAHLFRSRYTIGYWPWELQNWPTNWNHCFNLVDEVWAASQHIQQAAQRASSVPVLYMPTAVKLPDIDLTAPTQRRRFGLPENKTLFVFSFDGNSFIERKNPLAIINAFHQAFPLIEDAVGLVVKCMRPDIHNPAWQTILTAAKADNRLVILDARLSKTEVLELYRSCDCFISLHRAEGFGRGIAEALLLGLEVIASNYGGNTDFCRTAGARLIPCHLKATNSNDYVEGQDNFWAEPDISAAAEAMREVFRVRQRHTKGNISIERQQQMKDLFSPEIIGDRYLERLTVLKNHIKN